MDVTPRQLNKGAWQEKLREYCQLQQYPEPVYNIVSDRRGGRRAWSAVATVNGKNYQAKSWYDGQFLNEAKDDAAKVAYDSLYYGGAAKVTDTPSAATSTAEPTAESTAQSTGNSTAE